ncbi:hypothetical protein GGI22_001966, partial [Coemansia erecta]
MATSRQQSLPYSGAVESQDGMGVQFAVADYFDPYQSNSRGQTVDVDAAVASAAARGNGGPLARQQGKDYHRTAIAAAPPSPVMRATRHSRPSTPTSPVSPTGASPRTAQLPGSQLLPPPSAQSSIDSLRAAANGGTPVTSRTMHQKQAGQVFPPQTATYHLRTTASSTGAFNTPSSQLIADPNSIAAARMKPRSHTNTASMDIEGTNAKTGSRSLLLDDVRPIRPPPLPFPSRPRVSSMYDTGTASDPLLGESRARKAESPTKLDLGSSVAASSAGDLTSTTQRPIARPKNFKQHQQPKQQSNQPTQQPQPVQQQHQPLHQSKQPTQPIQQQPIQQQLQPLQQQRDRVVGPAGKSGSSETKKSNLIEFIEQQRQQHQAKMSAAQMTHAPRVAAQTPAGTSRPEAPAKLTSRSDSTGSMQSDSSERSFKRSTARLVEVGQSVASASAAHRPPISAAEAPANIDSTTSRAAKYPSWYGNNIQPRTDSAAPPGSTDPTYDPVIGLPVSTRLQPRVRAYSHTPPEPSDVPGIGGIRARNSSDSLGSCSYSRTPRATEASEHLPSPLLSKGPKRNTGGRAAPSVLNPYSRNPQYLSVAVQTDDLSPQIQPLNGQHSTASRGVQTDASTVIHGDDAVLDLMRQMDVQRSTHAVQITEYQEQVIDLELFNQDLATEIDQLTERLAGREKEH